MEGSKKAIGWQSFIFQAKTVAEILD